MDNYLLLRLLHIISAVVVIGTGAGLAYFMFMANRSNNPEACYVTAKHVVLGDWLFTMPAVITQFVTGWLLMNKLNYSFSSQWFIWVIGLFIFIGACWLPVIWIQYQLRDAALASVNRGEISPEFKGLMRVWTLLGVLAFVAILVLLWLMVFKPLSLV